MTTYFHVPLKQSTAKEEEMKIPWKEAKERSPVPEELYQEILAAKTGRNWIGHGK
jgi:hypothetical protein